MVPGRNSEEIAHRRSSAPPLGVYTCSPSKLSLSIRVNSAVVETYTFCVCLSPAQNRKSNSAARTTSCERVLGRSSAADVGRPHSALSATPFAGDEKMPVWFTGTVVGWVVHGSRGNPAGAVPTTFAIHDLVLICSSPQKSLSLCNDLVFVTNLNSLGTGTPGSQTVLCRGSPGTHTNFTNGALLAAAGFPVSAPAVEVSSTRELPVSAKAFAFSVSEKIFIALSTVAALAPVSRFTSCPSPNCGNAYVPLIAARSTKHEPHGPWPRQSEPPGRAASDAATQSTEHPTQGAQNGDELFSVVSVVVCVASPVLSFAVSSLPSLSTALPCTSSASLPSSPSAFPSRRFA
mmetsp:Transcript_2038/g.7047  ORF Transcript_2038/g.7047 Transcript_2038/m.7047 type:complete len:347 (+) Transcript_2038:582-1622(+)